MQDKDIAKNTIFEIKDIKKHYFLNKGLFKKPSVIKAIDGVSFEVKKGETYSIVGESGCGKSTLTRLLLSIEKPNSGSILFHAKDIFTFDKNELKNYRQKVQLIFQDSYSSLNPRWRVRDIIAEPLILNTNLSKQEIKDIVLEIMQKVGLQKDWHKRYIHQFSGGQRQRIGIARALVLKPEVIVCDEPVSALDVSIQAQILNLLLDLQAEFNLTYIFISHDLSVVEHISDRIMVMHFGKIAEIGSVENIFANPKHQYTKTLLSAIPTTTNI